ncbi:MAG: hypothetical protein ACOYNK_02935 [Microbacteriaceae bacterium]
MNKKSLRLTGIAVAAATFVAGIATMSIAATQTNGSDGPLHIWNGATEALVTPATSMAWTGDLLASSSSTDIMGVVTCPAESTAYRIFVSARGQERTVASWSAYRDGAFNSGKNIEVAQLRPSNLLLGSPGQAAVKAAGGDFSLGIACTSNSGVTVNKAFYRHITVTAGTGAFVAAATADVVTSTPTPTATADPTLTGTIALSATTTAAVNGTLSLSVPAGASATFGSPTLVNNKSTTTGTLPNVTVTDDRVVTRQGWTLSANVADFVNGGVTIGKANLGIAPSIVTGSTTAAGVTAGTATTAGSATYPFTFAEAAANYAVGNSVIGGNLTFVAPQDKAAGTYTSTLTLTLVSK